MNNEYFLGQAKVITSIGTGENIGRVQVKPIPQGIGWLDSYCPWALPFFGFGSDVSNSFEGFKANTLLWILYDKSFLNVYYLSEYAIKGFFDISSINNLLSTISELGEYDLNKIKFTFYKNGSLFYTNKETGDSAIIHKSGAYILINKDGEIYTNSKSKKTKIYNDNGFFLLEEDGTINLNNHLTVIP